ncbi:EAL domain-containing protein [Williamsia sp. D3]|uniref:sensor domain-containing protein n=1 Tax=Williamsia sp. D3 TaxID=1313067 RepID=UPI0003D311DC|nr:EAL domain-containing protein [Williamsia sp. D3]ETD30100.1 diguanylate cyclase [Williamsia sp. D3]
MAGFVDDPQILRAILELSPDLIVLSEFSGRVLYVNPAGRELVGLDESPDRELFTEDFFTPAGLSISDEVEENLRSRGYWRGRSELQHFHTRARIAVTLTTFVVERSDGQPSVIATIVRDRRRGDERDRRLREVADAAAQFGAEQKAVAELSRLALEAELPQLLTAATAAAVTLVGVETAMVTRVDEFDSTRLSLEAVTGPRGDGFDVPAGNHSLMGYTMNTADVVVCPDRLAETRFPTEVMKSYGLRSGVGIPIAGATAPWGALSVHSADARDYADRDITFLQTVADVLSAAIRRIELDRQVRQRSMHDPLTDLPNRALAYACIDEALERAEAADTHVAVLLLDVDDFKLINDSLGHEAGDLALVRFAQRLRTAVREQDVVARLGGDEFLILCEEVRDIAEAQQIAHSITELLGAPYAHGSAPTPLSASIGVAVSEPGSSRRELIHRADLAMYRAKDMGAGGHAVYDDDDVYDAERIRSLSIDLRSALERGELTLHYQPLVEIASGRIVAVEALARWNHPVHGPVSPVEFVAVAERTGLATDLGTWALAEACAQAARWREFTTVSIRVNVSALQLRDPAFPRVVSRVLAATGLEASALGLEITETVWVSDTARVAGTLTELHNMGVSLLLDDLGRGHSSIYYLDRYPVFECFKIDKSFIADLPGARPEAIVSAIVGLARAFDVTVVGEGVETAEQLEALRACGADYAQGYHLGRPAAADDVTATLRSAIV